MTYNVFGRTLNVAPSIYLFAVYNLQMILFDVAELSYYHARSLFMVL